MQISSGTQIKGLMVDWILISCLENTGVLVQQLPVLISVVSFSF